jgi:type VI secretion system protein
MSIVISIVKQPENAVDTKVTHTFARQGGTIGRSSDNAWILEDPERFISSQHSQISFENGQYYITDLSTNGTFSNGSPEPIGKGNTIKLNDGDKFALGDYEFLASAWQAEEASISANQGPFADVGSVTAPTTTVQEEISVNENDYFSSATNSSSIDGFATPFSTHVSNTDALFTPGPIDTDPLAVLDNARHTPEFNSIDSHYCSGMSQFEQANPIQESINWPTSNTEMGAIPENWEESLLAAVPPPETLINKSHFQIDERDVEQNFVSTPEIDKKSALEKANEKILAEIEILKKQAQKQALKEQIEKNTSQQSVLTNAPSTPSISRVTTNNEQSLIEALGLDRNNLSDEKVIEINQVVGELVRETITGMMQVLSSRSTIKNEFRMNVTTIQPVENNPLKFSANVDDAIENMFVKEGNAYKKPIEAIKEGFEGIAEHQVAILAGIRTAFKGVLTRFDPMILEKRFERFNKPGIIPGMSKAKNWDAYKHYYQELVDDMDNSFQHLFGYEFVQAYEEQLQKISMARKKN